MQNLDYAAAKAAQDCVAQGIDYKSLERVATKAIGVLQSQGIYALFLFLGSRGFEEKKSAERISQQLVSLGEQVIGTDVGKDRQMGSQTSDKTQPGDKATRIAMQLVANRERQMLAYDVFERTLTYIRFSAKAKEEKS
ncbi:MAG: hypothetical protein QXS20_01245 [Candidatus Thorarchaeota archaeon]